MHLTIQEFSKRTGLPPSKLRFYDKKELLQPSTRLENGYRAYSENQIQLAKMIDSLRQADIAIQDIKRYCEACESEKKMLLEGWKQGLDKRMEALQVARKYVGGIRTENNETLLLSKWEQEKWIVWQKFQTPRGPHPFRDHFLTAKKFLEKQSLQVSETVYVMTEGLTKDSIIGEVGFEVSDVLGLKETESVRCERIPPTLFAVMQNCSADDAFLCFSYIQLVIRYGFKPKGNKIERYENIDTDTFDYLIPVVK